MRLRFAALVLLVAVAGTARAADAPKPNALTPKEVADGWLLLFDGETTFGWNVEGDVKAADGVLTLGGSRETTVTIWVGFFDLSWQFRYEGEKGPRRILTALREGKSVSKADGGFSQTSDAGKPDWSTERWTIRPNTKGVTGTETKFAGATGDGMKLEAVTDMPADCRVELRLVIPKGTKLSLREVKLRPTALVPLFNSKDLAGWKKYTGDEKRATTEFSVTKEGWLHLKNGPGDLQTEGRYDDFVLQAECRTNGKNLNSGVFFRCIPGEYQNGYEAQIHNGFDAGKPKEYVVEEYDPATHELKGKSKMTSAAVDYGTGAIYRRVPARSQAAKDGEWFTMTVVANGRHVATWVNGVPQVDWTDNRPLKDNPRNGCRLEKGAISLQGHDPTTDIDFRSIRIVELPGATK